VSPEAGHRTSSNHGKHGEPPHRTSSNHGKHGGIGIQPAGAARVNRDGAELACRTPQAEAGSATNGCEKKLAALLTNASIVRGRVSELEKLLQSRIALAGSAIGELHTEFMMELDAVKERQKAELEGQLLAIAGELVQKLVRLRKVSEGRGLSLQRFRRQVSEGHTGELVRQYLAEPAATPAESAVA
jgi:hypothetical protein